MNQLRNTLDNARNWWEDLDFSPLQRKSLLVLALVIVSSSGFLVLRGTSEEIVRAPDFTLFAGGDMEPLTQAQIAPLVGRVDIYKVCHHGSKFQDESFTRALSPTISIISVGVGNSYGHPAPETIQSLTRLGSRVLRTDLDGAIAIRADRQRFKIRTSKGSFALLRWN
jgi:hypothetical protein